MTPEEWQNPNLRTGYPLCGAIEFLTGRITSRQIGLFLVACARRVWKSLDHTVFRKAVETTEQYLLQEVPQPEMENAWHSIQNISASGGAAIYWLTNGQGSFGIQNGWEGANEFAKLATNPVREAAVQMEILRDIFGDPFCPVLPDPRWFTSTAVDLARIIYREQRFDLMPILADSLQDAGCDDPRVLAHCRQPGEHVQGCWVIDLILGHDRPPTAEEWDATTDAGWMLRAAWPRCSIRKLRLAACGCCRQITEVNEDWGWPWWSVQVAVETAIEGETLTDEDRSALDHDCGGDGGIGRLFGRLSDMLDRHPAEVIDWAIWSLAESANNRAHFEPEWKPVAHDRERAPARIMRCVLGNPLRPPVKFPKKWKSAAVVDLARKIYDDHAFDRMPQLATLLEKVGCADTSVLAHCRDRGPFPNGVPAEYPVPPPPIHCRGCWVVDGILGLK